LTPCALGTTSATKGILLPNTAQNVIISVMRHSIPSIRRIVLLVCLLAISTGIASAAQTADAPILARVELTGAPASTLPVHAFLRDATNRDYALVVAPLSQLQQSGATYRVLDVNATRASDYVVALERRAEAHTQAAQQFAVLYDDGRQIVARLPFAQADALAALGFPSSGSTMRR
jgi:hypothetical protein